MVRDSGPGIAAADLPHIFDRFFRADAAAGPAQTGSGIGLALTKELVDLHRGTIAVESEEGFGSRFIVNLPRGRDHLRPTEIVEDVNEPLRNPPADWGEGPPFIAVDPGTVDSRVNAMGDGASGPVTNKDEEADDVTTVLLVEDNAEVRAYIRHHLAPDYRLIEAVNGAEGLERARTDLPDLVLSDVMMPEMDGFALCRALKEDRETDFIPVVLLTARADVEDCLDGLEEGADDYITKPFNIDELRARIHNLIHSREHLRERFSIPPRAIRAREVDASSLDRRFLDAVHAAVEKHLGDEDFTVNRLADAVGMSRVHLYRRLQDSIDESPSGLIRRIRLEHAAQLLAQQAGSVSEIAYGVGFRSVSHFSSIFREQYGHVPSQHAAETMSDEPHS